jgi:hypothetical protein
MVHYNVAVAARTPSPEPLGASFTKGEVNRAGLLLLDLRERVRRDGAEAALAASDADPLERAWAALTWWRSLHARPLSAVAANLRYHVDRSEARIDERIEVAQRLKRLDTLIGKLGRERGTVTQMQDIGGVRAVLPSLAHVAVLRRRLLKSWSIIRERDYIAEPKSSGYRALHLIVRRNGFPIEVQLRTIGQDIWANTVEQTSRLIGVELKFGAGDETADQIFMSMADLFARFDRDEISDADLREGLLSLPSLTGPGPKQGNRP